MTLLPGPSADDKVLATAFRQFWGDKSELRRFKDGAIVEAVVWQESSAGGGQSIPQLIVRHVLERRYYYYSLLFGTPGAREALVSNIRNLTVTLTVALIVTGILT